jgi:hypothetical protein
MWEKAKSCAYFGPLIHAINLAVIQSTPYDAYYYDSTRDICFYGVAGTSTLGACGNSKPFQL